MTTFLIAHGFQTAAVLGIVSLLVGLSWKRPDVLPWSVTFVGSGSLTGLVVAAMLPEHLPAQILAAGMVLLALFRFALWYGKLLHSRSPDPGMGELAAARHLAEVDRRLHHTMARLDAASVRLSERAESSDGNFCVMARKMQAHLGEPPLNK